MSARYDALKLFQSTLSVRRATLLYTRAVFAMVFQSTLSVRRATWHLAAKISALHISIHALRKESDVVDQHPRTLIAISIHALRKESDLNGSETRPTGNGFQSTLSVRRATPLLTGLISLMVFQSTLSVRRATSCQHAEKVFRLISIHALRKESDWRYMLSHLNLLNFNPRSP